ncbi:MAG: adenylosuccinate synthase [Prevotellaceae bacterium]|jgi:adenylosuccinate synthase|nr:adenylosuccinate synthase [Prevotellaceae bacterium]
MVDVILGLQWGDEGKGKIVDVLTPDYDVIARFQGGPNAGHTLEFEGKKFVLRSVPSGIFQDEKINVIGNGVVIDPVLFRSEAEDLQKSGQELFSRLKISKKAHLILPTHRLLDLAAESAKGEGKIGTTGKGIGPAYTDKTGRNGLRVGDILENFEEKYQNVIEKHKKLLAQYNFSYSLQQTEAAFFEAIEFIKQFELIDSEYFINQQLAAGKRILAEGAQGTMLDIDFGSYPFVTSSNTVCAGACTGLGVSPKQIGEVYGIFKAYCTRVGSGPFPTELFDADGDTMRTTGYEFGSVTGRPRRCGWIDLVALRYAIMINGVSALIMMKSDVLDEFTTIKACVAYEWNGKRIENLPFEINKNIKPIYKEIRGWSKNTDNISAEKDFPKEFSAYISFLEKELNVPIKMVSVGPDRAQTILR